MAEAQSDGAPAPGMAKAYRVVTATYRDKEYLGGLLHLDVDQKLMELRQPAGKKTKEEAVVARFRVEPNAEVKVDGAVLKVAELAVTLESPGAAGEIADLLKRPPPESEASKLLQEAESSVKGFLEVRAEATGLLSRIESDPRVALLSVASMWGEDDKGEPIDAVYTGYSKRLGDSLNSVKSSLAEAEGKLGPAVVERLFALAYTMGAVQDALFEADSDLSEELAAFRGLGVPMTEQDARADKLAERVIVRAHPALEALAAAPAPAS